MMPEIVPELGANLGAWEKLAERLQGCVADCDALARSIPDPLAFGGNWQAIGDDENAMLAKLLEVRRWLVLRANFCSRRASALRRKAYYAERKARKQAGPR